MSLIIDSHAHVFGPTVQLNFSPLNEESFFTSAVELSLSAIRNIRKQTRSFMKPIISNLHHTQTLLRYLPNSVRNSADEICGAAALPALLLESTAQDLLDCMVEAGVNRAVLIAQPPYIPNEFILELCAEHPDQFIAAVNIPKDCAKPRQILKKYFSQGAKILKIHPSLDGEGANSSRYKELLNTAAHLGLPIILHTGCLHASLFYKNPEQSRAELFKSWYESYPELRFILAHMNFHHPEVALDLCEEFENLWVDTSWQPAEVIGEAVRRIGAERVLFGTDWPFGGNNLTVGLNRLNECKVIGMLKQNEAQLILGRNALKLLNLSE